MGINKFNERIELREKYSRFRHVFPCKQNTRERDSEIRIISKKKYEIFKRSRNYSPEISKLLYCSFECVNAFLAKIDLVCPTLGRASRELESSRMSVITEGRRLRLGTGAKLITERNHASVEKEGKRRRERVAQSNPRVPTQTCNCFCLVIFKSSRLFQVVFPFQTLINNQCVWFFFFFFSKNIKNAVGRTDSFYSNFYEIL